MIQAPQITAIQQVEPSSRTMRVAAYCRVSSDSADQLHSYASQIQYYTDLISRQAGWELVDIYADEGITGTQADKRDDFLRMVNDCRKGKIDRVITKSVSRFARNTLDTIQYVRQLKTYGVSILFEAEQIDTAYLSSEMLLAIYGARAQEESLSISKNQKINCRARMKDGSYIISTPPYGYRIREDGELEIIPEEADVVKLIFDSYLSGKGKSTIANLLNECRICRLANNSWHERTIDYILRNERYIGDAILQKTYTVDSLPFRRAKNKGQLTQYYIENANPAIISRQKFEAVQNLLKQNQVFNARRERSPLKGKIHCSCNRVYILIIVRGLRYWECHAHNQNSSSCDSRRIPEADIQNAFIDMINKLRIRRKEILETAIAQVERLQAVQNRQQGKTHEIDRQIIELNGQNLVLARLHTKGILSSADYATQSGCVSQKVNQLRADRRKLLQDDMLNEYLDGLSQLNTLLTNTECQTAFDDSLFQQAVTEITVPTHTRLRFHLLGGLKLDMPIPDQRRCKRQ